MNFLPTDYQAPKSSSQFYLKLQDGENRLRILSKPIMGWEDWTEDRKPIRFTMGAKPLKAIDPKKAIKHFWAFIVWNVQTEQIQVMQITQATIRASIEALCKDNDWGDPFGYDIKIIRKGEGIETEYSVNPAPHKPVTAETLQAFKERPINLEALFISGDPFAQGWDYYTPLMTEEREAPPTEKPICITLDQFIELSEIKNGFSEIMQKGFNEFLKKGFSIDSLAHLPIKDYQAVKDKLIKRRDENQKTLLEVEMADTPEARKKK